MLIKRWSVVANLLNDGITLRGNYIFKATANRTANRMNKKYGWGWVVVKRYER